MPSDELTTDQPIMSVSDLTTQVKGLIEGAFPSVWVAGEISNFSRPRSGHCYLTLKDEQAQLRAVIWRTTAGRLRFEPEDGMEVVCQGGLDLYAPRGSYQLVIRQMHPKGVGALELALRKLREKLAAEGLFDEDRKRLLPRFPKRIAFVTSPTGAAVRDFLEVLRRRWRDVHVLVVPCRVQGNGAAAEIAAGIETVNRLACKVDVLVVGRGGGSLEDLWAFNEEVVLRAIAASRIPVVSAIGHEIDVTLSDLVADVRALTPSEAAELVVPDAEEVAAQLRTQGQRMMLALQTRATTARNQLTAIASRPLFRRPYDHIHDLSRQLDELGDRAGRAAWHRAGHAGREIAAMAAQLESLSPLAVLGRGYSLTQPTEGGDLVRDAASLSVGDSLTTRYHHGKTTSRIESIEENL
jgi:exodeoxyribonuclease VII large subunit